MAGLICTILLRLCCMNFRRISNIPLFGPPVIANKPYLMQTLVREFQPVILQAKLCPQGKHKVLSPYTPSLYARTAVQLLVFIFP